MLKFFYKLYENQVWNKLFWGRNIRCFLQLSPSSVSVQHDGGIDTYRLMSVSILYRYWLYRPSPNKNSVKLYNLCDIMPYVVSIDVWQYYSKVI